MLDILDKKLGYVGEPTNELENAAEVLRNAAIRADVEIRAGLAAIRNDPLRDRNRIRNGYYDTLNIPRQYQSLVPIQVPQFVAIIREKLKPLGDEKGPVLTAKNNLELYARRAFVAGYPLQHRKVQSAFVEFLMALVTAGFKHKDTTGTQMGNFRGVWTGGGYGAD